MLKSLETFLILNYFYSNAKKMQIRQRKTWTNFDLKTDSLIEKY